MRFFFFFLSVFLVNELQAQFVNQRFDFKLNELKLGYSAEKHTAFKNSFCEDIKPSGTQIVIKRKDSNWYFSPIVETNITIQSKDENVFGYGIGGALSYNRKQWNSNFTYLTTTSEYVNYQSDIITKTRVVPGMNVGSGKNNLNSQYIAGFINYKPNKLFDFEVGYGKSFIGDGYRSLLRSDAANSSPYLKINTSFWKIKYTNLFASHQNIFNVEGNQSLYQKKYSASHFLDYKATKWLTIGLFETIIWQAKEGNYTRGFDPNYANPFIFYRPVEFSVGSSDNALVGANIKIQPFKNQFFYVQVVFDEFLLDELKADVNQFRNPDKDIQSGWWANKYGLQIGWNAFDLFKIEGLQTRLEFNLVRPFTYAHSSPTQAYSHYNVSLAHPLGANFHEFISIINYSKDKWMFKIQYNQSQQGHSLSGTNFGENLQLSNTTRVKEYENSLNQGVSTKVNYLEFSAGYLIYKDWNTSLNFGYISRTEADNFTSKSNKFLYLKLKSNLYNQYFDY